jgi:hypothetical protein
MAKKRFDFKAKHKNPDFLGRVAAKLVKEGNRKFVGPLQVDKMLKSLSGISYSNLRKFAKENPDLMDPPGSVPKASHEFRVTKHDRERGVRTKGGSARVKYIPTSEPQNSIGSDRLRRLLALLSKDQF